jgi:hypothetical protein
MKFFVITILIGLGPFGLLAQARTPGSGSKVPMTLDSFYLKAIYDNGNQSDYAVYKTSQGWRSYKTELYNLVDLKIDPTGEKGLMKDSINTEEANFSDIPSLLMHIMNAKGTVAKDLILTPMLPCDNLKMLIDRPVYLKNSWNENATYLDQMTISINRQIHLQDSLLGKSGLNQK